MEAIVYAVIYDTSRAFFLLGYFAKASNRATLLGFAFVVAIINDSKCDLLCSLNLPNGAVFPFSIGSNQYVIGFKV